MHFWGQKWAIRVCVCAHSHSPQTLIPPPLAAAVGFCDLAIEASVLFQLLSGRADFVVVLRREVQLGEQRKQDLTKK